MWRKCQVRLVCYVFNSRYHLTQIGSKKYSVKIGDEDIVFEADTVEKAEAQVERMIRDSRENS